MTQLNSYAISGNPDSFRHGAAAFRNARDWAKGQRDKFINDANNKAQGMSTQDVSETSSSQATVSAVAGVSLESDTSADELALDEGYAFDVSRKRLRRTPSRSASRRGRRREEDATDPARRSATLGHSLSRLRGRNQG
jgi:hypothetical protein